MPRKEKTFFGKIMGGDVIEENEITEVVDDEELEDEDEIAEEQDEDLDDEYDEEASEEEEQESEDSESDEGYESDTDMGYATSAQEESNLLNQPGVVSAKDEEWMNDYEGALNIDMYQTKDNVIIKSTIAGVRPDDIDITVANDMVTIRGARTREEKVVQDDYFYQECYWGNFSRSVIVPVDIDSEHIEADLKDGILTIIVPKAAKAKTKKVKVKG